MRGQKWSVLAAASMLLIIFIYAVAASQGGAGASGIEISEICSRNFSAVSDNKGHYPDFIEIHNKGDDPVSLKGCRIRVGKSGYGGGWIFPDAVLQPREYRICFLSKDFKDLERIDLDDSFNIRDYVLNGAARKQQISNEGDGWKERAVYVPLNLSYEDTFVEISGRMGIRLCAAEAPELVYDTSYSRIESTLAASYSMEEASIVSNEWAVCEPSPGKPACALSDRIQPTLKQPIFSREGGFYEDGFLLELRTESKDAGIFYTLDGSVPNKESRKYVEPIRIRDISETRNIWSARSDVASTLLFPRKKYGFAVPDHPVDKCTVVRAVAIGRNGEVSQVTTNSYFVGYAEKDSIKGLPVLSLVSDPKGIFGYERGIYTVGKTAFQNMARKGRYSMNEWSDANYHNRGREWERPASLEIFSAERERTLRQEIGVRIKGNWSRSFPQKSLNLYARNIYGEGRFAFNSFGEIAFGESPESLTLFCGGNDIKTKLVDILASRMASRAGLNFSVMRFEPCYLFLDGEEWGLYYLTEKYSKDYLRLHFGVDPQNVVMIKNHEVEIGEGGDLSLYEDLRYLAYLGLQDPENYKKFCEIVDIEGFADYYAFRIYIGNINDWPSRNFALWRSRKQGESPYEDCRWRYLLFDVNNASMDTKRFPDADALLDALETDDIFRSAMKNKDFQRLFIEKLVLMAGSVCSSEALEEIIDPLTRQVELAEEATLRRYFGSNVTMEYYRLQVDEIKEFFALRREGMALSLRKAGLNPGPLEGSY